MTIHPVSETFVAVLPVPSDDARPEFELITTLDGLICLADDWNALFERAGAGTQLFQRHAWVLQWARVYLPGVEAAGGRLAVLAARCGGRLVTVWPMVEGRGVSGRVVAFAGCPVSQYGDALVEAPDDASRLELLRAGWRTLIERLAPDTVVLERVRADATIAPLVAELGGVVFAKCEAPWLALAAGCGESFEARQKSAARKNRRRLMRRLEQAGPVSAVVRGGSAEAMRKGYAALAMKRDWLARTGQMSRAFADERIERFFGGVLAGEAGGAGTRVHALMQGERAVAYAIAIACKARLTLHVIVHDAAFDDCGAGLLNIEACLRQAEQEGFEAFDLLPPRADYKMKWATNSVSVADHAVGVTARGRTVARIWHGLLRDRAKTWASRLPLVLKRRLWSSCP